MLGHEAPRIVVPRFLNRGFPSGSTSELPRHVYLTPRLHLSLTDTPLGEPSLSVGLGCGPWDLHVQGSSDVHLQVRTTAKSIYISFIKGRTPLDG